ncbi:Hypothetical predicted protein [Pelobates cultripes]|nr:Hypothetical predicted protein [Pelobates cultripes]
MEEQAILITGQTVFQALCVFKTIVNYGVLPTFDLNRYEKPLGDKCTTEARMM